MSLFPSPEFIEDVSGLEVPSESKATEGVTGKGDYRCLLKDRCELAPRAVRYSQLCGVWLLR